MRINNINSIGFKAIYAPKSATFNDRELEIATDIYNKLKSTNPEDSKKRTYENWLQEERGINLLLYKNPKKDNVIVVEAIKGSYDASKSLYYTSRNDFTVGEYSYVGEFNPKNIRREEKAVNLLNKIFHPMTLVGIVLLGMIFPAITKRPQAEKIVTNPETKQELIHTKDSIVDSLKNIKKLKF